MSNDPGDRFVEREDRSVYETTEPVLYEARDAIAADLVKSIQGQLDRLQAGILIVNVNVQNVWTTWPRS